MTAVKMSSKNQIVLPKGTRNHLKLKPGDELAFIPRGDNVVILARPRGPSWP